MENENTVSIPLVDVLSQNMGKRIVMNGDDYVELDTLKKVPKAKIDECLALRVGIEKNLTVPLKITMRQARLYLLEINLLDEVESIISQERAAQIEWEYAADVLLDSPLIRSVQSTLQLSNDQIADMFIAAGKL